MVPIHMGRKSVITCIYVLAIVILSIVFFNCAKFISMTPDEAGQLMDSNVHIGVVVALTGKHAEAYGFAMQRGFELARDEINSRGDLNLTFITVDDQSSASGATEAVQHLVDQGVSAIVGLAISTHLKAAAPIAQKGSVIAFSSVSSAAGLSGIGDFIFRTSLATNISIPSGLKAIGEKLGYKKVATIYDEIDVYSTNSNEVLKTALETNGVEVLTMETFRTGDTDFSQQFANIIAMEPDALFVSALSQEIANILGQTTEAGVPDSIDIIV
ncbi:ABC transporter substrate-binding protein, partial [Candidatus Poribacteria bacterium]|nr:ABC transporter substrate-binding protein [Candidatus Poribacteria bacterium]